MNSPLKYVFVAVCILVSASLAVASDTSFRCGTDLISDDDTMYEVESICGPPDIEKRVGEMTNSSRQLDDHWKVETVSYITEWVYRRANGMYVLTFEGSRLVKKELIK